MINIIPNGIKSYTHSQIVPAIEWTIEHNLNTEVTAVDCIIGGEVIFPHDVIHVDPNTTVVQWSEPRIGIARIV
jgi:hypothetical protein